MQRFSRTEYLLGPQALERLGKARVAVFGLGGVGGYVVEGLARTGVGGLHLIDGDTVSLTNLNRQIIALESTIGRWKTQVLRERVLEINPQAQVEISTVFFTEEIAGDFDFSRYDYVVDAIDTVTSKLALIRLSKEANTPVITCLGAGNKLDPTAFRVADISETSVCPLARVMRRELKKRGITGVPAVFSTEPPRTPQDQLPSDQKGTASRPTPGSLLFPAAAAGLLLASTVVQALL